MVTDWDENFVELQWEQPKTDGGSPVTEFSIQKKERGSPYWVNAVTVPGKETKVRRFKVKKKLYNCIQLDFFKRNFDILGNNSRLNQRTRIRI